MNDLQAVLAAALRALAEGAAGPAGPWRTLTLATAPHPIPGIRSIVLRRFSPDQRIAELHTDARSPKLAAIKSDPRAALHGWDPASRVQLRLDGEMTVADAATTDATWAALPATSRSTYAVSLPPGTPIPAASAAVHDLSPQAARAVFTVLQLRFDELEYLSLEHGAHRRARFRWRDDQLTATWLVP